MFYEYTLVSYCSIRSPLWTQSDICTACINRSNPHMQNAPHVAKKLQNTAVHALASNIAHNYYRVTFVTHSWAVSVASIPLLRVFLQEDLHSDLQDHVNMLMTRPITYANMSTQPIVVTRAQTGWFFKQDKSVCMGGGNSVVVF